MSFPPHCSHRMQPLDVGVFGPFKAKCKISFNDRMTMNAGKLITISEIASLTTQPHLLSFTPSNIINACKKPGIWPLNRLDFTEDDFAASYVTDRPLDTSQEQANSPSSSRYDQNDKQNDPTRPHTPPKQGSKVVFITPEDVRPFPKAAPRKRIAKNNNRKGKSRIFKDSSEKDRIAELERVRKLKNDLKVKRQILQDQKKAKKMKVQEGTSSESDNDLELPSSDLELSEKKRNMKPNHCQNYTKMKLLKKGTMCS